MSARGCDDRLSGDAQRTAVRRDQRRRHRRDGRRRIARHRRAAPSSEWRFHRDIYAARNDAKAIVHTHSPFATTLACLDRGIPAFHYMVAVAGGTDIRCAPYATFGTQELSDHAVRALDGRRACLLAHHGMIAIGASLDARAGAGRRSRNARRNVLARAADRRAYAAAAGRIGHGANEVRRLRQGVTQPSSSGTSRSAQPLCNARRRSAFRWYGPCTSFCAHCLSGVFRCALYVSSS